MQTPQPSVLNHFNSLPDNLNNYKQNGLRLTECNSGDDEDKANNDDELTDESYNNNTKPRSLSHSLNNKMNIQHRGLERDKPKVCEEEGLVCRAGIIVMLLANNRVHLK